MSICGTHSGFIKANITKFAVWLKTGENIAISKNIQHL